MISVQVTVLHSQAQISLNHRTIKAFSTLPTAFLWVTNTWKNGREMVTAETRLGDPPGGVRSSTVGFDSL